MPVPKFRICVEVFSSTASYVQPPRLGRILVVVGVASMLFALAQAQQTTPHLPTGVATHAESKTEIALLRQINSLAQQGHLAEAMAIYRQLYGTHPPNGDIALAYYQTLYGTASDRQQAAERKEAIEGMRSLVASNPNEARYRVQLGVMLTYDPHTRKEGIRMLAGYPSDPAAQAAWRQALVWDSPNPASAPEIRAYVAVHPQDADMIGRLRANESKLAQMKAAHDLQTQEAAAFAALNAHQVDVAGHRFSELLQKHPKDGKAAEGLGFVQMQKQDFGAAVRLFTQAQNNGVDDQPVKAALSASQFWYTMGEASKAFRQDRLALAEQDYHSALAINPHNPDAYAGLAGLLLKEQRYEASAGAYGALVRMEPASLDSWRGLFLADAYGDQDRKALAVVASLPYPVRIRLDHDLQYLDALVEVYQREGRTFDALRTVNLALDTYPGSNASLSEDAEMRYGQLFAVASQYEKALSIFHQVVTNDPQSADAWQGLISCLMATHDNEQAVHELSHIPPSVRAHLESKIGFLQAEFSLYATANDAPHAEQYIALVDTHYAQYQKEAPANLAIQNAWLLYNAGRDQALSKDLTQLGKRTDLTRSEREAVGEITVDWNLRCAASDVAKGDNARAVDLLQTTNAAFPANLSVRKALAEAYARVGRAKEGNALFKQTPMQDASVGDFEGAVSTAVASNDRAQTETWLHQALQRFPNDSSLQSLATGIEGQSSGWLGATGLLSYRTGNAGYDQLLDVEAPVEGSMPVGNSGRLTVIAIPAYLDSGRATGDASISVLETNSSGEATMTAIPEPIGTYVPSQGSAPLPSQTAAGAGAEVQLAYPNLALAVGTTPLGFLVPNASVRALWKPNNGSLTLSFTRDSEKDSQLSYAGLRDPASIINGTQQQVWGGVVYNQAEIKFDHGNAKSGFYLALDGQYLTGRHVKSNNRVDGTTGAYRQVFDRGRAGKLNVGVNLFDMHYANNQYAFTYGLGGYFSPQNYLLASIPFSWTDHTRNRWHYSVKGAVGVQTFHEAKAALWPFAANEIFAEAHGSPMLPAQTFVGPNYDFSSQVSYRMGPHWIAGAFFNANNSLDYTSMSTVFYVRYLFRKQPAGDSAPAGMFPSSGLRPVIVP